MAEVVIIVSGGCVVKPMTPNVVVKPAPTK